MKMIGLLGGMSWESSIHYERLINTHVRKTLGGANSADLIIRSFNFANIEALQSSGNWNLAGIKLAEAARNLQNAGAEAIVLCTNTMHVLSETIEANIDIPLLHIADAVGEQVAELGLRKVLLLGTRYTMSEPFYAHRLAKNFGLDVSVPTETQRDEIHRIIYEELVQGVIKPESRRYLLGVISELKAEGIDGVIAGCTEIELLLGPEHVDLPYFPTTAIHAAKAAGFALS